MAFRIRPVNGNTMGHETSDNENVDNMDPYFGDVDNILGRLCDVASVAQLDRATAF